MYLVNSRTLSAEEPALQEALAAAYDRHARPCCLCTGTAVPVYIAKAIDVFVVKRMPLTGHLHDPDCRHHDRAPGESPSRMAAIRKDVDTGITHIRASFALCEGTSLSLERALRSQRCREWPMYADQSVNLRGVVEFLWQEAELNQWKPAYEGRRSWAVVRYRLLRAGSKVILNGVRLQDALFVPEVFRSAEAEAIRIRRAQRFRDGLQTQGEVRRKMVLVGELKEIITSPRGVALIIKHLPDTTFWVHEPMGRRVARFLDERSESCAGDPDGHRIIAATFALTKERSAVVDEYCTVPMSARWIPLPRHSDANSVERPSDRRDLADCSLSHASTSPAVGPASNATSTVRNASGQASVHPPAS